MTTPTTEAAALEGGAIQDGVMRGTTSRGTKGCLTLVASGSRGDVQPQVAMARALQDAGWTVRFATHSCFESLTSAAGLELFPLAGDPQRLFGGPGGAVFRERLGNPAKVQDLCRRFLGPFIRGLLSEVTRVAEGSDALLYWPPCQVGPSLAEALQIPCVAVTTYPLPQNRTRAFPNPFAEPLKPGLRAAARIPGVGGWINRWSWGAVDLVWSQAFAEEVSRWRSQELGLQPQTDARTRRQLAGLPHLLGYSQHLLKKPKDWPRHFHVTGYWFLDLASTWEPPAELVQFLEAGEPPIAIGFGSMVAKDPKTTTEVVLAAVKSAGVRAVLLTGWGGLGKKTLGEDVLAIRDAPHDWLFPRVAGVVHHGGSGTTAAGLRAGLPTLVVPFGFDQYLWGRQIEAIGVGPPAIPNADLTVERLAEGLRRLARDARLQEKARGVGQWIRAEDGCRVAAEIVEQVVAEAGAGARVKP